MSQLKKQSVASRRQPRRGKTNTSLQSGGIFSNLRSLAAIAYKGGRFVIGLVGRPCVYAAKRWPKTSLLIALSGLTGIGVCYGLSLTLKSVTQSLPESVEVNSPRPELQETVLRISSDTLTTARNERWSRTALTDKLLSRISLVDGVDEVSIRAGLDRRLRIDIAAQSPILIIEAKGGERILVGSKFKIISRNVNPADYGELPILEASDLALNVYSAKEKRKAQNGLFVRPPSFSSANIRWLSQQTLRIQSLFNLGKLNFDLERISWRSGTGFSIVLKQRDSSSTADHNGNPTEAGIAIAVPASTGGAGLQPAAIAANTSVTHRTTVILGEVQFKEKFERLNQVMQDLRLRKTAVEQIDLAFSDKAIIRMSENHTETKRGGVQ